MKKKKRRRERRERREGGGNDGDGLFRNESSRGVRALRVPAS